MNTTFYIVAESMGLALFNTLWQGFLIGIFAWIVCFFDQQPARRYIYYSSALLLVGITFCVNLVPAFLPLSGNETVLSETLSLAAQSGTYLFNERLNPEYTFGIFSAFSLIWVAGFLVFAGRLGIKVMRHKHWMKHHVNILSTADAEYLSKVVGFRQTEFIRIADYLNSPAVSGWIKPVILLPAGYMLHWPPDQLYTLLLHEWQHIKRKDHWILLIQHGMEVILFFHPVVWWLNRNIHNYREIAVDDEVMKDGTDKFIYAKALYQSAINTSPVCSLSVSATGRGEHLLHQRIERILFKDKNPGSMKSGLIMLFALFLTASIITGVSFKTNIAAANYTPYISTAVIHDTVPEKSSDIDPLLESADKMRMRLIQIAGQSADSVLNNNMMDSTPPKQMQGKIILLRSDKGNEILYNGHENKEKEIKEFYVFRYTGHENFNTSGDSRSTAYDYSYFFEPHSDPRLMKFDYSVDSLPVIDHVKLREQIQHEMEQLRRVMEEQRSAMEQERVVFQERMPEIRRQALEESRLAREEVLEIRRQAMEEARRAREEAREMQLYIRESTREARNEAMEQLMREREAFRAIQMEHREEMRRLMEEIRKTIKEVNPEEEID